MVALHEEMALLLDARRTTFGPTPKTKVDEDFAGQRREWREYSLRLARPVPDSIEVEDVTLATGAGDVPVRIYRPLSVPGPAPCVVYMHGGGFVKGDLDSSDTIAWGLAEGSDAVVVSVDYRLAPEHPYPAAFDDCYGVLAWLAASGDQVGVDPGRIALAGDSAGGNLAAALCLAARDRGGPAVAGQVLVYPGMCADTDSASYDEHADSATLTTAAARTYYALYLGGLEHRDGPLPNRADPYAAPSRATDHGGLPPALVHTAGCDPIRDDGRRYAAQLALAGTDVAYREARGMLHGFLRLRLHGPACAAEFAVICDFLRAQLGAGSGSGASARAAST